MIFSEPHSTPGGDYSPAFYPDFTTKWGGSKAELTTALIQEQQNSRATIGAAIFRLEQAQGRLKTLRSQLESLGSDSHSIVDVMQTRAGTSGGDDASSWILTIVARAEKLMAHAADCRAERWKVFVQVSELLRVYFY